MFEKNINLNKRIGMENLKKQNKLDDPIGEAHWHQGSLRHNHRLKHNINPLTKLLVQLTSKKNSINFLAES